MSRDSFQEKLNNIIAKAVGMQLTPQTVEMVRASLQNVVDSYWSCGWLWRDDIQST